MRSRILLASVLAALSLCACTKENPTESVTEPVIVNVTPADTKAIEDYYSNWAEFIKKIISESGFNLIDIAVKLDFPEIGRLEDLDIRDGNGAPVKFGDLSEPEQTAFIECAAVELAAIQCAKAVQMSALYREFGFLNDLIVAVSAFADKLIKAGTSIDVFVDKLQTMISRPMVLDVCSPFPAVEEQPATKGLIGFDDPERMSYPEFISQMAGVARKGDFAIIIPVADHPETLWNLKPYFIDTPSGIHHAFGHCAIVMDDFKPETSEDAELLYGAVEEGVNYESSSTWLTDFYLLEPVNLEFIWDIANTDTPLRIEPVAIPRPERDKFVTYAKQYEHASFINMLSTDWFVSKRLVPEKFTCASFLWHCCQNVYGLDISVPFIPTVAPINVVCSPYTIIKKFITTENLK
ncbi:MAG: hypothetical protein MJY61_03505 [Bacteroidales bacterium]|nr:hypothetical protein [Bacteroidales bacterium]